MLTPELLRTVAEIAPAALSGLREVWSGGDVLAPDTVRRIREHCPDTAVVNGYGPTETTVFATAHTASRDSAGHPGTVPIGRPLDNTRALVLDARLRPVPAGATGELYIGGSGLAQGYLGRPVPTAERFVADPYGPPGSRMYRTGDLARWTPDGVLEFAGRADDQVKVRGFRVEPAEVEAALADCPGVARAVVGARRDAAGGKLLAAWLLPAGGRGGEEQWQRALTGVREHAAEQLPAHLVPSLWVRIDEVPLTRHGKVDRAALPEPGPTGEPAAHRAPRTTRERELCALFGTVLGMPAVGPDTDFFLAGGHSLTALRLKSKIETVLGVRIPVSALFDAPTPAALAARLDAPPATNGPAPRTPLRATRDRHEPTTASGEPHHNSLEPVLTLRTGGRRTPLICVHPGLGLSWSYVNLLPHLDPARPVHTLQSPALLNGVGELPATMGEMADQYLRRVRELQPHGPYLLIGRSFGGPLAHELAAGCAGPARRSGCSRSWTPCRCRRRSGAPRWTPPPSRTRCCASCSTPTHLNYRSKRGSWGVPRCSPWRAAGPSTAFPPRVCTTSSTPGRTTPGSYGSGARPPTAAGRRSSPRRTTSGRPRPRRPRPGSA